jgi:hypothetical protein
MPTNQAVQPETEQRMSFYDLVCTPEFKQLSPKMGQFVLTYLQSVLDGEADALAAVKAASYNCKSDENGRILGFQLLASPKIILVMNRFFGVSPTEAFLKQVRKAISNKKLTIAQVRALELYSNINGFEKTAVGIVSKAVSDETHRKVSAKSEKEATVPADAISIWKNRDGEIIGYRDASGKNVQLLETK